MQSHPAPPCPAHTHTPPNHRWVPGDGLCLPVGYRGSTEGCYMGIKQGKRHWKLLVWFKSNPSMAQLLQEATDLSSPAGAGGQLPFPPLLWCIQSNWGMVTLLWLASTLNLHQQMKITLWWWSARSTTYGTAMENLWMLLFPPKIPSSLQAAVVLQSLSFQHVGWEFILNDLYMDTKPGRCLLWLCSI